MIRKNLRWLTAAVIACNLALFNPGITLANHDHGSGDGRDDAARFQTTTPIKHVVVIFQENVSFDGLTLTLVSSSPYRPAV